MTRCPPSFGQEVGRATCPDTHHVTESQSMRHTGHGKGSVMRCDGLVMGWVIRSDATRTHLKRI